MTKVVIVIATWNSEIHLHNLFTSLQNADNKNISTEIIIVENGSTDSTPESLVLWQDKFSNITEIIWNSENIGFSPGYNQGIREALKKKPDFIALLNDDIIVEPDWLPSIIERMKKDKSIGITQPLLTRYPSTDKVNTFGNYFHFLGFGYCFGENVSVKELRQKNLLEEYEPATTTFSAVVIRSDVFENIGLLDENYFAYHEDTDFCFRARLAGYTLLAFPGSVVHHAYKTPVSKSKIRYFWLERGRLYLVLKFFSLRTLFFIFPAWIFMECGLIFYSLIKGFYRERAMAYKWIWQNRYDIRRVRAEVKNLSHDKKDKKLFRHMTGKIEFQEIDNPLLIFVANPILNFYLKLIKKII